jgi:hypothetical protein
MDIDETHGKAIRKRVLFFGVGGNVMPMKCWSETAHSAIEITPAMRMALADAMGD